MEKLIRVNNSDAYSIDFEPVFRMMNDELSIAGESLDLICAGGYVLQLCGLRGTADIDAFYKTNAVIDSIIRKVGEVFGLNKPDELWLNNSVSNMNKEPPEEYCETVHRFSHLIVKAVDLLYLMGMKFISARGQDIKDLTEIVKNNKDLQPFELLPRLFEMGFNIDIAILLDVFEGARGMEWLDDFYRENEVELSKYF